MSPKFAPQNVASIVKLLVIPIWRHITTRAVDSLHLRTRNLHPLNENLSGAWDKITKTFIIWAQFNPISWQINLWVVLSKVAL